MEFADTNIVLYAASVDPAEREKAKLANDLLEARNVALSAQVLQEFYVQATRTTRADRLTHEEAVAFIETLMLFPVQAVTPRLVTAALTTCRRYEISYWDAAILEAARSLGCDVVLSEDLSDGQDYAGVRVENPFRGL